LIARHAAPHGEAFLRVEPIDPFQVHGKACAPQEDVEPAIAEPAPLAGQDPQAVTQRWSVWASWSVATRRAAQPDEGARPALA